MSILFGISFGLQIALLIYTYVLWARLILDWVVVLKRDFRPKGFFLILVDGVYRLTDPPLRLVRKVIPPIRIGNIMLDIAWIVVIVACRIIIAILP
ncbi:YggT family protein [Leucobacter chinensis]|uniref:YggT family protein n=1 Tax=Leucobacter chinensis TaxID=2851010 RepID=UPI001C224680